MKNKLISSCLLEEEQYIWFSEHRFNGLYRLDKSTQETEFLCHFPEEDLDTETLFGSVVRMEDYLVFSPVSAKNIVLYHTITGEMKTIPLPQPTKTSRKIPSLPSRKFFRTFVHSDFIYFFPITFPAILRLNMINLRLEMLTDWVEMVDSVIDDHRKPELITFFYDLCTHKAEIFLPLACTNHILTFSLTTGKVRLHKISGDVPAFLYICFDGEHCWITPLLHNAITKWNPKTGKTTQIPLFQENQQESLRVLHPLLHENKIFLLVAFHNTMYSIDIEEEIPHKVEALHSVVSQKSGVQMNYYNDFMSDRIYDSTFSFISLRDMNWYSLDLKTQKSQHFSIDADQIAEEILSKKSVKVMERPSFSAKDFTHFLKTRDTETETVADDTETVGEKILKAVIPS